MRNVGLELADARRHILIAPAGHGKTHAIADAVAIAAPNQGRQLILTHTHAGVHSLYAKLASRGVPRNAYRVDTIAGWCLRYCAAYPKAADLEDTQPRGAAWDGVYKGAKRLLSTSMAKDVVRASYGGLFVDEYQDCQLEQHYVVLALADLLPCRILGDPLQAIFGFRGTLVSLDEIETFDALPPLEVPHRWINAGSHTLGEWLADVRAQLLRGDPVSLEGAPIELIGSDHQAPSRAAFEVAKRGGTAVAMHRFPDQAHNAARRLSGIFCSMEELDCEDLMKVCERLDSGDAVEQAIALVDHAGDCLTAVKTALAAPLGRLLKGQVPEPSKYAAVSEIVEPLAHVATGGGAPAMVRFLLAARSLNQAVLFRRELFEETIRALRSAERTAASTFAELGWQTRDRTRQRGRKPEARSVSRTLLVKGLEYDHAMVLQANLLDRNNLYVALTRGSKSVWVQTSAATLNPS